MKNLIRKIFGKKKKEEATERPTPRTTLLSARSPNNYSSTQPTRYNTDKYVDIPVHFIHTSSDSWSGGMVSPDNHSSGFSSGFGGGDFGGGGSSSSWSDSSSYDSGSSDSSSSSCD